MATDLRMRTLRVELPGARALHLCLTFDADGEPADLVLGAGYASDNTLKVLSEGVNVPAQCLPALRDALASLDAAGTHEDRAESSRSTSDVSEAA